VPADAAEGHTVLLVPVPELEPFVRERTAHYDAAWLSTDPTFVHAHVTLLAPFLAEPLDATSRARLEGVLGRHRAFSFDLSEVATFPNGIVHLLPDPAGAFRALTDDLVRAFPQCPPYAGQFPDPTPHLTLDLVHAGVTEAGVRAAVRPWVPALGCVADRVQLTRYVAGGCRVLEEWALAA
jgi:hypothetical protein